MSKLSLDTTKAPVSYQQKVLTSLAKPPMRPDTGGKSSIENGFKEPQPKQVMKQPTLTALTARDRNREDVAILYCETEEQSTIGRV